MENELIRRDDVLNALRETNATAGPRALDFFNEIIEGVEDLPAVEAVEVVFCHQCGKGEEQYGQMSYMDPPEYLGVMCEVWEQMMDPCDYCSKGISKSMTHPPVDNVGSPFDDSNEVQPVE